MTKAGRPQGDPRGATEEANELARFLRELTDGMRLRALADRYPCGRTLWGDYRLGAQVIPLPRLNTVIKDRVPDARGQQNMLAKARDRHDAALTAEAERPAVGLGEALERAKQDIAEMGCLIKALLARIDVLEDEAARQPADARDPGIAGRPVQAIAAQLDVLRQRVTEARRVRDATLEAYGAARSGAGEEPGGEEAVAVVGSELVGSLAALHDTAARQQEAMACGPRTARRRTLTPSAPTRRYRAARVVRGGKWTTARTRTAAGPGPRASRSPASPRGTGTQHLPVRPGRGHLVGRNERRAGLLRCEG